LETFTYACHFGPLLVVVAALATLTRARRVALGLILTLIVCVGINNLAQFREARTWVEQRAAAAQRTDARSVRAKLTAADEARPSPDFRSVSSPQPRLPD